MREKWDNIFTIQGEGDSEGPLENTTTKNLLKVLKDTNPESTIALLNTAFPEIEWDTELELQSVQTQRSLDGIRTGENSFLLAISQTGKVNLDGIGPTEDRSTIDGFVKVSNPKATIGIEVKTGDASLDAEQLVRYADRLGIASTGRELFSSNRFATLSWYEIAGLLQSLYNSGKDADDDLSQYLYGEFVNHLLHDHLRSILSSHGGDYPKTLSIFRQRQSSTNWSEGDIMFDLRWKGNSVAGAFSSKVFNQLLGGVPDDRQEELSNRINKPIEIFQGIPEEIRFKTFGGKQVSPAVLYDWARDEYPELNRDGGNHNLSCCEPLNDGRTYRLHFKNAENGSLGLRLVRYDGTHYNWVKYPNLVQSEFESIFGGFPQEVREKAFCDEPNTESLWETYLRGKIGPAAEHRDIDPLENHS